MNCKGCGRRHRSCKEYCQTCQSERRRLRKIAEGLGWTVGSGSTYGWVFDKLGEPLASNHDDSLSALRAAFDEVRFVDDL